MKSHILALLVLLTLGWKSYAENSNALSTNLLYYTLISGTNLSEGDLNRILNRLEKHHEGPVRGSMHDFLDLAGNRVGPLLQRQIINDFGFTDMDVDQVDRRVHGVFLKSARYGGEDLLVRNDTFLRIDSWTRGFFSGSVNVDQRLIDPTSPYYQEAEANWWRDVKEKMRYGMTERYVFVGTKIDGYFVNARYFFQDNFSFDQRVDGLVSKPLGYGWSFSSGVSYSTAASDRGEKTTGVGRFNYAKGNKRFSVAFKPGDDHPFQIVFWALL